MTLYRDLANLTTMFTATLGTRTGTGALLGDLLLVLLDLLGGRDQLDVG